jgi:hypothetical protein
LAQQWIGVAQFGVETAIPVERRLFADRNVALDFGAAGDLTKAVFSDAKTAQPD